MFVNWDALDVPTGVPQLRWSLPTSFCISCSDWDSPAIMDRRECSITIVLSLGIEIMMGEHWTYDEPKAPWTWV